MAKADDELDYLRRRLARLETIVAMLFVFDDYYGLDPRMAEEFRFLLRRSLEREVSEKERPGFPEDELFYMLDRLLSRKEFPRGRRFERRLSTLEERAEKTESTTQHFRQMFDKSSLELRHSVDSTTERLNAAVSSLRTDHQALQENVHGFFAIQTFGLDVADVPLPRFMPVRVYLSEDDRQQVRAVSSALEQLMEAFGFTFSDEFPEEKGSFWKKWFAKTTDVASQPEVAERLKKIERALEMKGLHEPQADIDKKEADAVATLAKAVENIPNAALQAGSVLLVKTNNPVHGPCIQARTLTQREMILLEKNQKLLASPHDLLEKLSEASNQSEPAALPAPNDSEEIG